jgi:hypothetical protein
MPIWFGGKPISRALTREPLSSWAILNLRDGTNKGVSQLVCFVRVARSEQPWALLRNLFGIEMGLLATLPGLEMRWLDEGGYGADATTVNLAAEKQSHE